MKIVIINGSPRNNGTTGKILNFFNDYIKDNYSEISIEYVNLMDCNIKFCTGCKNCYRTGKCLLPDEIEKIHDIINSSNGIIFGSPTYASNETGLFKSFHDRVHMTMAQLLYRKPCINITTYENAMGKRALKIMNEMVMNAGGYNVRSLAIKNAFNQDPLSNKNKKSFEKSCKTFIKKINRNKPPLFSRIYTKIAVNIFMKPFVFKDKENNKGIIDSWLEKKLIK